MYRKKYACIHVHVYQQTNTDFQLSLEIGEEIKSTAMLIHFYQNTSQSSNK